eukprot:Blabericola_migrator_1__10317@NODE_57_length_15939_cov_84_297253_g52_i0_p4_GENE_NODE_57_length_15939_cov_84_297253_g52_i0NODE_57_length_15939_cov_84_297253_g52_i0_p4_ORF_typecomplete_len548_score66_59CTP_transf_like/PF01467_26/0_00095DUF5363/PF17320_2/0_044FAD_syn/PF06574_12/6_8e03FAD_syn/PF06574_12/0_15FAD_syn/PF06574_12/7_1e03_NODE_57_length_15939_cov_84_297253_g52_i01143413077
MVVQVESWVIIVPKHLQIELNEKWMHKYYRSLEKLDIVATSWLLPSIHVLIPSAAKHCEALCRATYYLLMYYLDIRERRSVHIACCPYACQVEDITRMTPKQFVCTFPAGWQSLWLEDYQTRFATVELDQANHLTDPTLGKLIRALCANVATNIRSLGRWTPTMLCFGGSFDGLHPGHLTALNDLVQLGSSTTNNKLIAIAISDDAAISTKDKYGFCLPFKTRRRQVLECIAFFLELMKFRRTVEVRCEKKPISLDLNIPPRIKAALRAITSAYDTIVALFERDSTILTFALTDLNSEGIGLAGDVGAMEALFITPETMSGAEKVNNFRLDNHLPPLRSIVAPLMWPVDALLLSQYAKVDAKISSRNERELFHKFWNYSSSDIFGDPKNKEALDRRRSYDILCQEMGLDQAQQRILLRWVVAPVHMYGSPAPQRKTWTLDRNRPRISTVLAPMSVEEQAPAQAGTIMFRLNSARGMAACGNMPYASSIATTQCDLESVTDVTNEASNALMAAKDFVRLFLEDESVEEDDERLTTKGLTLLECVKGQE